MLKDFFSLIFPKTCLNCKRTLTSEENHLCLNCKIDLPFTNDNLNPTNLLFQKFAFEPKIKSASSLLYFQRKGIAQKILHELKYNGQKDLGVFFGAMLGSSIVNSGVEMIIPVPLHKSKKRKRTYNQSEQIGIGVNMELDVELRTDILSREIATSSQTQKSKADRWINMTNVYSTVSIDLSNKSVLVVDDVITTGATIGMLCERLVEANVTEIHIACLARGK